MCECVKNSNTSNFNYLWLCDNQHLPCFLVPNRLVTHPPNFSNWSTFSSLLGQTMVCPSTPTPWSSLSSMSGRCSWTVQFLSWSIASVCLGLGRLGSWVWASAEWYRLHDTLDKYHDLDVLFEFKLSSIKAPIMPNFASKYKLRKQYNIIYVASFTKETAQSNLSCTTQDIVNIQYWTLLCDNENMFYYICIQVSLR